MTNTILSSDSTTASTLTGDDTLTINTGILLHPAGPSVVWNLATAAAGAGVVVTNNGTIAPTSGRAFDTSGTATAAVDFTLDNNGSITGVTDVMRIQKSLMGGSFAIDNTGTITASAGRGFNLQEYNNLASFTVTNHANATIQSTDDAIRLTTGVAATFTGTLHVDNFGTIKTNGAGSGQALDFNDIVTTATGHITIDNETTGIIQAADADAIRGGDYATINNHGHITSLNANVSSTGNDAIDFQASVGGVVNNFSDGVIDSARHGITGDKAVTITNDGHITGELGSGVNLDTASTVTSTLTNQADGVITGNAAGASDGDGVDIDGLVQIDNYGQIIAQGTWSGGLSEGLSVGGGTIHNYEGGVITSDQRAITVDDSNLGNAFAATSIINEGTIDGGNGEAISITDTFADTITNKGEIDGSIATGGGDDVFNLYAGSSTGSIDGGAGSDTIHLVQADALPPPGAHDLIPTFSLLAATANVEVLSVESGAWLIESADSFSGGVTIADGASLQLGDGEATGSLDAAIANDGALVLDGSSDVVLSGVISGHGSLTQEGDDVVVLNGHNTYDGGTSLVHGSLVLSAGDSAGTGPIIFAVGSDATLVLDTGAFTGGDFGVLIKGFAAGDAIDLEHVGTAAGVSLGAGNVLTVSGGSQGDLTLHLDPTQDYSADRFHLASDGISGTVLTMTADLAPVASAGETSGDEDTVITGAVSATDGDNDPLTYVLVDGPDHAGAFTFNADGTFSYTGAENFNGSDSFTFQASDGDLTSQTVTFTIGVNAVNDAPVITGGGAVDHEVVEAGIDGSGVAGAAATAITFSDPDTGDTPAFDLTGWSEVGSSSLYTLGGQYGVATLDILTGIVTYALNNNDQDTQALASGQSATDSFTITVSDGHGGTASQVVSFAIEGDNDPVLGTGGADTLAGTAFADELHGQGGSDLLMASFGDDLLDGGSGQDTVSFAGVKAKITADLAAGTATGAGADTLVSIENLVGSNKADHLSGDAGANQIDGGAGNDVLSGGGGADTLTGGAGNDIFHFSALSDSRAKAPVVIADLEANDRIDLRDIDANATKDGDQKFKVVEAFTHHAGQLTLAYDAGHDRTVVSLDVDGDAKADMTIWIAGEHSDFNHFVL